MNLVFVIGKVVSDIKFDFIINGPYISIAKFEIELSNGSVAMCKAYNEIADFCYSKLKCNDKAFINGEIVNGKEIIIKYLCKI